MRSGDVAWLAWSSLRGHRLRTSLSLLGMVIGVAAVVVLTALGEGARRYVVGQFQNIGTNLLIVMPGRSETAGALAGVGSSPTDLTIDDAAAVVRQIGSIRRGAPIVLGSETVASRGRSRQVMVIGSTPDFLEVRHLSMAAGRFLPEIDPHRGAAVVVLGAKTARELFPNRSPLGAVVRAGSFRFRVIGVLAPLGTQMGINVDDLAIVPVTTAARMYNRSSLNRLLLEVRSAEEVDRAKEAVERLLGERHRRLDVTVVTQESVVGTFTSILTALTLALGAIGAISLSVAGVGIMNVMLVSVSERTAEVGLMKALGAARGQVTALFVTEAALLAALGGLLGLAGGWILVRALVALYPELPAAPPQWAVAAALAVSIVVGVVFGAYPARRAATLDPLAALERRG